MSGSPGERELGNVDAGTDGEPCRQREDAVLVVGVVHSVDVEGSLFEREGRSLVGELPEVFAAGVSEPVDVGAVGVGVGQVAGVGGDGGPVHVGEDGRTVRGPLEYVCVREVRRVYVRDLADVHVMLPLSRHS